MQGVLDSGPVRPVGSDAKMTWLRSNLRLISATGTVCGWLFLATQLCVDVGSTHAEIALHLAHGEAEPHRVDLAAHPECLRALSGGSDRGPAGSPVEVEAFSGVAAAMVALAMPEGRAGPLPVAGDGRVRFAPLYLLHATFLI